VTLQTGAAGPYGRMMLHADDMPRHGPAIEVHALHCSANRTAMSDGHHSAPVRNGMTSVPPPTAVITRLSFMLSMTVFTKLMKKNRSTCPSRRTDQDSAQAMIPQAIKRPGSAQYRRQRGVTCCRWAHHGQKPAPEPVHAAELLSDAARDARKRAMATRRLAGLEAVEV